MTAKLSQHELDTFLSFAHRLADASGKVILPHFRKTLSVENKLTSGFDPVTIADTAAEAEIRALIRAEYPSHSILGEEYGRHIGDSHLAWVLDPIDGTRAFITGQPLWGTLIALNDGTTPIIGVLDQPYMGERFFGHRGGSTFRGPTGTHPLQTRPCKSLDHAILSSTHPELFKLGAERTAFQDLERAVRMTRFGGDCYAYGLLAMGFVDLVVEAGLKPFDIQALIPIIEGAGGIVTNWRGGSAANGGQIIACGDPHLHEAALKVLSSGAML